MDPDVHGLVIWKSPEVAKFFKNQICNMQSFNIANLMTDRVRKYHPNYYTHYLKKRESAKVLGMSRIAIRQSGHLVDFKKISIKPSFSLNLSTIVYYCYFENIESQNKIIFYTDLHGYIEAISEEADQILKLEKFNDQNLKFLSIFFYVNELFDLYFAVSESFRSLFEEIPEYKPTIEYEEVKTARIYRYFFTSSFKIPSHKYFARFEKLIIKLYHKKGKLNYEQFRSKLAALWEKEKTGMQCFFVISRVICDLSHEFFTIELLSEEDFHQQFQSNLKIMTCDQDESQKIQERYHRISKTKFEAVDCQIQSDHEQDPIWENISFYDRLKLLKDLFPQRKSDLSSNQSSSNSEPFIQRRYNESKIIESFPVFNQSTSNHVMTSLRYYKSKSLNMFKLKEPDKLVSLVDPLNCSKKNIALISDQSIISVFPRHQWKLKLAFLNITLVFFLLFFCYFVSLFVLIWLQVYRQSVYINALDSTAYFYGILVENAVQLLTLTHIFAFYPPGDFQSIFHSRFKLLVSQFQSIERVLSQNDHLVQLSALAVIKNMISKIDGIESFSRRALDALNWSSITKFIETFEYDVLDSLYTEIIEINQSSKTHFPITFVMIAVSFIGAIFILLIVKIM